MKVNMGTKKAEELIQDFNRRYYKGVSLYDCYKSVSAEKAKSWRDIEDTCRELNGWDLHITGASAYTYSCMYAFKNEDGNIVLRKETHANTYDLILTPDEYNQYIG